MMKLKRILLTVLSLALLLSCLSSVAVAAEVDLNVVMAQLGGRGFMEPDVVGHGPQAVTIRSSAIAEYNGRTYVYATSGGGKFNVIDLEKNELVYATTLENVDVVWTHNVDSTTGNVYICGVEKYIYMYSPATNTTTCLGQIEEQPWSTATDEDGNLYIGTYADSGCRVFKYDVSAGKFENLGLVDNAQSKYARSMVYYGGKLYIGLGSFGKIMCMDLATNTFTELCTDLATRLNVTELSFTYDMALAGHYMVARVDSSNTKALVIMDMENNLNHEYMVVTKAEGAADGHNGFIHLPYIEEGENEYTYVTHNGILAKLNLKTGERTDTGVEIGATLFRGCTLYTRDGVDYLVALTFSGDLHWYNLDTYEVTVEDTVMEALPVHIQGFTVGNNGKLYMSSYPGGPQSVEYDLKTRELRRFKTSQADSMQAGDGDVLYLGCYPGAVVYSVDTNTLEMTELYNLEEEYGQDRIFGMAYGDGKLAVGTVANYTSLGSVLSIYDSETGEVKNYTDDQLNIPDLSIVSLAYSEKTGLFYGGTGIYGGTETNPEEGKEAIFFTYDPATEENEVYTMAQLGIERNSVPSFISGLAVDEEGYLWGCVDGILFKLDPSKIGTEESPLVKSKNIYPSLSRFGKWVPMRVLFGDDGLVYTNVGAKITAVDPSTENWDHVTLAEDVQYLYIELAYDAEGNQNLYYLTGDTLMVIRVVDGGILEPEPEKVYMALEMENPSFENYSWMTEGWAALADDNTCSASAERAKDGTYSLLIHGNTSGFVSDAVDAFGLVAATATAQVYVAAGTANLSIQWLDVDGVVVQTDKSEDVSVPAEAGWQQVTVSGNAPKGAVSLRLIATCGAESEAWFDTFELSGTKYKIETGYPLNGDLETGVEEGTEDADGVSNWKYFWSSTTAENLYFARSNEQAKNEGGYSLKLVDTANDGGLVNFISDPIPVTANEQYKFDFSTYYQESTDYLELYIKYYTEANKDIPGTAAEAQKTIIRSGNVADQWIDHAIDSTAPADAAYARIWFCSSKTGATNAVYIDDMSFSPAAGLVANAGFENGVNGWQHIWTAEEEGVRYFAASEEQKNSGGYSLKLVDTNIESKKSVNCVSNLVPVTEGQYKLDFSTYYQESTDYLELYIKYYDASAENPKSTTLSATKYIIRSSNIGGQWIDQTIDSTAPADAAYASIWFCTATDTTSKTNAVYIDDVFFAKAEEGFLSVTNPSVENTTLAIDSWVQMPYTLNNEVAGYSITSDKAHDGNVSLKLVDIGTAAGQATGVGSAAITIPEGKSELSATAKLYVQSGHCSFLLRFYDESGAQLSKDAQNDTFVIVSAEPYWQDICVTTAVPENAVTAKVFFMTQAARTSETYIDDVVVSTVDNTYHLDVENGSGTGIYAPGTQVTVTADTPADGYEFDRWVVVYGDIMLEDVTATSVTITIPENAVMIKALYRCISD